MPLDSPLASECNMVIGVKSNFLRQKFDSSLSSNAKIV